MIFIPPSPPLGMMPCPCSYANFCSSLLFPPCPPASLRTELLPPGVHRLSYLRTSSLSSAHSDSRPNSPFRHHFIPQVKGKEAGFQAAPPAGELLAPGKANKVLSEA